MGNQQSAPHDDSHVVLTPDEERHLAELTMPIPGGGGFRSTPELRDHLHETIFGSAQPSTTASSDESLAAASPALRDVAASPELAKLLRSGGESDQIDINTLATILSQLNKTLTNGDLALLRKALFPAVDSDASLLTSREYRGSIIRKRSLHAPGAASRSKVHNKHHKQPSTNDSRAPAAERPNTWAMEQLTIKSPLSAIASLQDRGPNERASLPAHRPATPSDLECSNLGALQLGTLRVTNGAVTPEPSILSGIGGPFHIQTAANDDYFTCSEGFRTDDDGASPGNAPTDESRSTISACDSPATPNAGPRFHTNRLSKKPQHKLAVSPLGSQRVQRYQLEDAAVPDFGQSEVLALYSSEALSNPFSGPDDEHSLESHSAAQPVVSNFTPERASPAALPDAESIYSELTPKNSVASKKSNHGALERLTGRAPDPRPQYQTSAQLRGPAPGSVPLSSASSKALPQSTQVLAVRNSQRKPSAPLTVQTSLTPGVDLPTLSIPSPPFAQSTPASHSPLPFALNEHDPNNASPTTPVTAPLISHTTGDMFDIKRPAVITDSPVSAPGSAEGAKKRNKLQKKRFSKQAREGMVYVPGVSTPPLGNVPAIAPHVAASHQKRMHEFPTMDSLDHTFETASAVDVRSYSPERSAAREIRFPSPAHGEESPLSLRGRSSRRSSVGPGTSPSRLLRSLSRKRSRSRNAADSQEILEGDVFNVHEFGSVPEMASRDSPYHAVVRPNGRPQSADVGQLSNSKAARSKPVIGMDDKTASALAKWRSRDHLENNRDLFEPPLPTAQPEPGRAATPHPPAQPKQTKHEASIIPPIPQMQHARYAQRPQSFAGARPDPTFEAASLSEPKMTAERPAESPTVTNDGVWKAQAEFWKKQNRQSSHALLPSTSEEAIPSPKDVPLKASSPPKANPPPFSQTHISPLAAAPRFQMPREGARSPSPSVRERAALFEKAGSTEVSGPESPSWMRGRVKQPTAATSLSTYESTAGEDQSQASSGASDNLSDIMFSGGPGEQRWCKARNLANGGSPGKSKGSGGIEGPYADLRSALRHVR